MTIEEARAAGSVSGSGDRRLGHPAATDLIARLQEAAERMVPFSQHKILLRAAASAIERLDAEARHHAAEVVRLTTQLDAERPTPRGS